MRMGLAPGRIGEAMQKCRKYLLQEASWVCRDFTGEKWSVSAVHSSSSFMNLRKNN